MYFGAAPCAGIRRVMPSAAVALPELSGLVGVTLNRYLTGVLDRQVCMLSQAHSFTVRK